MNNDEKKAVDTYADNVKKFKYITATADETKEKTTLEKFRKDKATDSSVTNSSWTKSSDGLTRTRTQSWTTTQETYNYKVIGPFKLKFNEENGISSVKVYNTTQNANNTSNKKIYWIEKSKYSGSTQASDWNADVGKIPSNTSFYLAVYNHKITTTTPKTRTQTQTRASKKDSWGNSTYSSTISGSSSQSSSGTSVTPENGSTYKVIFYQEKFEVWSARMLF